MRDYLCIVKRSSGKSRSPEIHEFFFNFVVKGSSQSLWLLHGGGLVVVCVL